MSTIFMPSSSTTSTPLSLSSMLSPSSTASSASEPSTSFRPLPLEPHFALSAPQTSWVFFNGGGSHSNTNARNNSRGVPFATSTPSSPSSSPEPTSPVAFGPLTASTDSVTAQLLTAIGSNHNNQSKPSDNLAHLAFFASVEMSHPPQPRNPFSALPPPSTSSSSGSLASLLSEGSFSFPLQFQSQSPPSSGLHKLLSAATSETPINPFRNNHADASSHYRQTQQQVSRVSSSASSPSKQQQQTEAFSPPDSPESSSSVSRIKWTYSLHDLFLKALDLLGDEAIPSKIVKVMNVPGLTRDHVSSHLQKHRLSEKKRVHTFDPPSFDFPPQKKHCPSHTYDSHSSASSSPHQTHFFPSPDFRFADNHTSPSSSSKQSKTDLNYIM